MKLYITPGSPYARIARIVAIEKGEELQITLACGLGLEAGNPYFHWRPQHPKLCDWFGPLAARPSFAATLPPRLQLGDQKVP